MTEDRNIGPTRVTQNGFAPFAKPSYTGGPISFNRREDLPDWYDKRSPGSVETTWDTNRIMAGMEEDQLQRFQQYMRDNYKQYRDQPWAKQWYNRTSENWNTSDSRNILRAKIELVRRLAKIKVSGPESMEDWLLLFLLEDGYIRVPDDFQELVRPASQNINRFGNVRVNTTRTTADRMKRASTNLARSPANPPWEQILGFQPFGK